MFKHIIKYREINNYPATSAALKTLLVKSKFLVQFWSYNPEKINFGALRVLNDDIIAAGISFGAHQMIIWRSPRLFYQVL
jgi:hypothetical protein